MKFKNRQNQLVVLEVRIEATLGEGIDRGPSRPGKVT